ncbi:MAG: hypothetical protein ACPLYF_02205 [Fervidobacterium sp.]
MLKVNAVIKVLILSAGTAALILFSSCGPSIPKIIKVYQFVPTGEFGNRQEMDNVIIEVKPIDETNWKTFPEITPKVTYTVIDPVWGKQTKTTEIYLLGANVQFKVSVTNKTGHVLRFSGSVIKLMDDLGNMYDPYLKSEISTIHAGTGYETQISEPLRKIKYLDTNVEILPDMTWTGYIAFQMPLKDVGETFKFVIYDLITQTDEAGNPKRKSRFEFNFKKEIVEKTGA